VIDVAGRLTLGEPVQKLREQISATRNAGRNWVLVNLADATYVDSAGMGELGGAMAALRNAGGELKLSGVSDRVRALFEVANLHRVLEIHPHEAAALASFVENSSS
jgi:anti-sigma B factor antagonist